MHGKSRILKISKKGKITVVLVKGNTQKNDTADNIMGYYFESEDTTTSLF